MVDINNRRLFLEYIIDIWACSSAAAAAAFEIILTLITNFPPSCGPNHINKEYHINTAIFHFPPHKIFASI